MLSFELMVDSQWHNDALFLKKRRTISYSATIIGFFKLADFTQTNIDYRKFVESYLGRCTLLYT